MKTHPASARGFTLIEIALTVAVLLAVVALYGATLSTVSLTSETGREDVALRIANQKLDDLRALGYAALPASGPFTDTQLQNLPSGSASTTVTVFNAKTKQVAATVSWVEAKGGARSISLTTLITQVGGL